MFVLNQWTILQRKSRKSRDSLSILTLITRCFSSKQSASTSTATPRSVLAYSSPRLIFTSWIPCHSLIMCTGKLVSSTAFIEAQNNVNSRFKVFSTKTTSSLNCIWDIIVFNDKPYTTKIFRYVIIVLFLAHPMTL